MAMTASFKQQCPSCEAWVPIRDANLVGRKIDCPKCKYRFVVEDPGADAAADDDAPKKKGKKDEAAGKKGTKGKAKRRGEGDDESGGSKGGSSKVLVGAIVGVVTL